MGVGIVSQIELKCHIFRRYRLFKTSIKEDSVSESQDDDYGDMCRRIMQYDGSSR